MANLDNVKGKKILVIGLGKSGQAAVKELVKLGANVSCQDSKEESEIDPNLLTFYRNKGVRFYLAEEPGDDERFDMVVLSPGVSPELPFVVREKEKGAEITGELEIAYRVGHGSYVAITGTNGKTTTTTLTGEIFKKSGRKTYVVGNIGTAVITTSAEAEESAWMVVEASSFQLETTKYFKPKVSAVLNLTPDHLNRHHTMEEYGKAKSKIFANQTECDYLVINKDDEGCFALSKAAKAKVMPFSTKEELAEGAFLKGNDLILRSGGAELLIAKRSELKIIGEHNVQNVLAAALVAWCSGIEIGPIRDAIKAFPGVEHRIEYVGETDGIKYYNDSKGTNTDATITAIKALEKDIILIAGGDAKSQDFTPLAEALKGKVKKVLLLGRDHGMIEEALDKEGFTGYEYLKDMTGCVRRAHEIAEEGDKVLLSPACASWDMYDNYEQRGRHFKELVRGL